MSTTVGMTRIDDMTDQELDALIADHEQDIANIRRVRSQRWLQREIQLLARKRPFFKRDRGE
jgi:hypothetical protein